MRRILPIMVLALTAITLVTAAGSQAQQFERTPLNSPPLITHDEYEYRLTVKFVDSLKARAQTGGEVISLNGTAIPEVTAVAERHQVKFRPQIKLPESELASLEARARARSGREQPDLAGMMIADMPTNDHQTLRQVARELRNLPEVEYVYLEPLYLPDPGDIPPETPDLVAEQDYRGPDPGMDVDYAWTQGATGGGIRYADAESAWNYDHEDLNDLDLHPEPGQTIHPDALAEGRDNHGTAVVGETSSAVNAYGCSGMTPDAPIYTYPQWTAEDDWRRVDAVTNAINDSGAGDIVLLEMQTVGPNGGETYVPAEYDNNVWVVVKAGTDAGVIVVAAAGNGGENLDHADFQDYMDRGDSGAILVGAGSADTSHDKLDFSTYGSRVDMQGWGESVFTLGYGDFEEYGDDYNQRYTHTFNGTSSASPFVASAALAVQSLWESFSGTRMTPAEMRAHLIATGIPQGSGGHIGPLPNLRDAINELPGYNEPPVAVCEDLVLSADDDCQAFATADDVGGGSFDPDGDTFVMEISFEGPFPLGETDVTLTVTDEHGTTDSCVATITVVDTTAPVVACPASIEVECSVAGGVPFDDPQLVDFFDAFTAVDNCDDDLDIVNDAPVLFAGPCDASGGVTVVTWTVTDDAGNVSECSANVTVVDTTPPEIMVTVEPEVLWPPNHKMVEVEYTVTVSDICDDDPQWVLVSLVSDEPDNGRGDGNTVNDIQDADLGTPDNLVSLRSERSGAEDGRIYTATFEVTDCNGNATETTSNVYVPHSASDFVTVVVSGSMPGTSPGASFMISGATIWEDDIPVDVTGGDGIGGAINFVEPVSAFMTNTAGVVRPNAFFIKDVDFDEFNDVLVGFDLEEIEALIAASTPEDGDPVMVLEVGRENFLVLDLSRVVESDIDLAELIDELRDQDSVEEPLVQDEVVTLREAGLIGAAPNPFNPSTTIKYYLPDSRHVELAIFDIRGRQVARLVSQTVAAGEHSVMWHGKDSTGGQVASGVYFYRLTAGRLVETKRMILVK